MMRYHVCPQCDGRGKMRVGDTEESCLYCGGTGAINDEAPHGQEMPRDTSDSARDLHAWLNSDAYDHTGIHVSDGSEATPPLLSSPYTSSQYNAPPPPNPRRSRRNFMYLTILSASLVVLVFGSLLLMTTFRDPHSLASKTSVSLTQAATATQTAAQGAGTSQPTAAIAPGSATYPPTAAIAPGNASYPPTSTTAPGQPSPTPYPTMTPSPTATPQMITDAMSAVPDANWYQSSGANKFIAYMVGPEVKGIARNTGITDSEWAEWHYTNVYTFNFVAFYCTTPAACNIPEIIRPMQIMVSSDGFNWSNPAVNTTYTKVPNRPWTRVEWTGTLSHGVNFIKITWPTNPLQASWDPLLANARFTYYG